MNELAKILGRLDELANQNTVVLDTLDQSVKSLDLVQNEVRNALSRLAMIEERVATLESERAPPFRAPMPSYTSEERAAERGVALDSIRAAVEHQTEKQTPMLEATARASKLTPYAVAAGIIVSAFVSGLMQNCHMSAGGHSWGTSSSNYLLASDSSSSP